MNPQFLTNKPLSERERRNLNRLFSQTQVSPKKVKQKSKARNPQGVISRTNAPVSKGYVTRGRATPKITESPDGSTRVRHREHVTTITSSTLVFALALDEAINPSNPVLFKWLTAIASRFETYKFRRLRVRYIPSCPTTQQGYVAITPDFNPKDSPPTSKTQMLQYQSIVTGPPWQEFSIVFRREDLDKRKSFFCNNENPQATSDLPTYDTGRLFIAVGSQAADNVSLGDLWLEYDIDFQTPEYNAPPAPFLAYATLPSQVSPRSLNPSTITSNNAAPLSNSFSVQNNVLTALENIRGVCTYDARGTGFTASNAVNSLFAPGFLTGTGTMNDTYENIVSTTNAVAQTILELQRGDKLDLTKVALNGGFTTLTHSHLRFTPRPLGGWGVDDAAESAY